MREQRSNDLCHDEPLNGATLGPDVTFSTVSKEVLQGRNINARLGFAFLNQAEIFQLFELLHERTKIVDRKQHGDLASISINKKLRIHINVREYL